MLWKELLRSARCVQLQVPSHVLVSKNPVVSWWDVPNSESVIDAFLFYQISINMLKDIQMAWRGSGGPLVYWRHHWNNLGAGHLGPFRSCKAKMLGDDDDDWQETRKISFFTARLASFSITQDSFCKILNAMRTGFVARVKCMAKTLSAKGAAYWPALQALEHEACPFSWRKASAVERLPTPSCFFSLGFRSNWFTLCEFIWSWVCNCLVWSFLVDSAAPAARPCDDMVVELTVQAGDFGKLLAWVQQTFWVSR